MWISFSSRTSKQCVVWGLDCQEFVLFDIVISENGSFLVNGSGVLFESSKNFNPRLRTSSSVWESWASERIIVVLRVELVFCLGEVGLGFQDRREK